MSKLAARSITTWAAIRNGYLPRIHRRMQQEKGLATLEYVILGAAIVAVVLIVGTQIADYIQNRSDVMTNKNGGGTTPTAKP